MVFNVQQSNHSSLKWQQTGQLVLGKDCFFRVQLCCANSDRRTMSSHHNNERIRVGVLTDVPLRLEGLAGIFEDGLGEGYAPLSPIYGTLEELLSDSALTYLVLDLNIFYSGVGTVGSICRRRPEMRVIIFGPEGNDKLIMDLIQAGLALTSI